MRTQSREVVSTVILIGDFLEKGREICERTDAVGNWR